MSGHVPRWVPISLLPRPMLDARPAPIGRCNVSLGRPMHGIGRQGGTIRQGVQYDTLACRCWTGDSRPHRAMKDRQHECDHLERGCESTHCGPVTGLWRYVAPVDESERVTEIASIVNIRQRTPGAKGRVHTEDFACGMSATPRILYGFGCSQRRLRKIGGGKTSIAAQLVRSNGDIRIPESMWTRRTMVELRLLCVAAHTASWKSTNGLRVNIVVET